MNRSGLKKGDRVIATRENNANNYKIGDTGTLLQNDVDSIPMIKWDHTDKPSAVYSENVMLLSEYVKKSTYQIY